MKRTYKCHIKGGKLIQSALERTRLDNDILNMREGEYVLSIEKPRKKRSLSQNAFYWGGIIEFLYKFSEVGYEKEEWHELLLSMFSPVIEVLIPHPLKQDETMSLTRHLRSSEMSTSQMVEYIDQILRWSASELGLHIPDSDEYLRGLR